MINEQPETGTEKRVIFVKDEAWAINRRPLDNSEIEQSAEWVQASYILSEVVHALLPDGIAAPIGIEPLVEDAPNAMNHNVLRRTHKIDGLQWDQVGSSTQRHLVSALRDQLENLGLSRGAVDGFKKNFIFPTPEYATYVDSLDPMVPTTGGEYLMSANVEKLLKNLETSQLPEAKKSELQTKLKTYQELTNKIKSKFSI